MKQFKLWMLGCSMALFAGCQSTTHLAAVPENAQVRALNRVAVMSKNAEQPVIALVLGSGGARGYAHIGVIEVLEQHGIRPDFIVGTSAGSIVGSVYASGKTAAELREIALQLKANDIRDVDLSLKGFFNGQKVEDYINQQVRGMPLQQLKIPMYVVATELKNGKQTVFNYGNTGQAVRASVSIPSMFKPTKIGEIEYVDGGLVSPVPVQVARDLGADIVIQPDLREKAHIFDVKGREITIQAGVDAAQAKLADVQAVIKQKSVPAATQAVRKAAVQP